MVTGPKQKYWRQQISWCSKAFCYFTFTPISKKIAFYLFHHHYNAFFKLVLYNDGLKPRTWLAPIAVAWFNLVNVIILKKFSPFGGKRYGWTKGWNGRNYQKERKPAFLLCGLLHKEERREKVNVALRLEEKRITPLLQVPAHQKKLVTLISFHSISLQTE